MNFKIVPIALFIASSFCGGYIYLNQQTHTKPAVTMNAESAPNIDQNSNQTYLNSPKKNQHVTYSLVLMLACTFLASWLLFRKEHGLQILDEFVANIKDADNPVAVSMHNGASHEINKLESSIYESVKTIYRRSEERENERQKTIVHLETAIQNLKERVDDRDEKFNLVSHKLTIGALSAEIAHEINNPLGIMMLRAQQIERYFSHGKKSTAIPEISQEIVSTGKKIAKIITGLKEYSRGQDGESSYTNSSLSTIISNISSHNLQIAKKNEIDFHVVQQSPDVEIFCQSIHLSEAIQCLVTNAIQALSDEIGDKDILIKTKENPSFIEIEVSDSGPGISQDVRKNIMAPFFSTKKCHAGLGLSIAKNIVEAHKGELFLKDDTSRTTFVMKVPKRKGPLSVSIKDKKKTSKSA